MMSSSPQQVPPAASQQVHGALARIASNSPGASTPLYVGAVVSTETGIGGFKARRMYNDIPKGTLGYVLSTREVKDRKGLVLRRMAQVSFHVRIDDAYKKKFNEEWKQWFPTGYVAITHWALFEDLKKT